MSTWKRKALEYLPRSEGPILAASDRQSLWREMEREFYAAVERDDAAGAAGCVRYAAWDFAPNSSSQDSI